MAIASATRIEWVLADLAIMCAGGATTTVYPTTQHEDVSFILADSGSKIVFAEDELQVAKVLDHVRGPARRCVQDRPDQRCGRPPPGDRLGRLPPARPGASGGASGRPSTPRSPATGPEKLATVIYTSGTTGRPKGVRLVHDSWTYEGMAIEIFDIIAPDDLQYLWLPLSHVFGKALITIQLQIGFTTAIDGRIDKIVDNLGAVQPTFMAGAPRIFEKVRARVMMGASHGREGQDLRLGVRRSVRRRCRCGWRDGSPAGCSVRSTRWPIGWCSARSRPGWVARSGSSSPARRRSAGRCRSGSTPRDC